MRRQCQLPSSCPKANLVSDHVSCNNDKINTWYQGKGWTVWDLLQQNRTRSSPSSILACVRGMASFLANTYFPIEPLCKAQSSVSADTVVGMLNKTCAIWHCLLGLPWRMGGGSYCRAESHEGLNLAFLGAGWSTGKCRSVSRFWFWDSPDHRTQLALHWLKCQLYILP